MQRLPGFLRSGWRGAGWSWNGSRMWHRSRVAMASWRCQTLLHPTVPMPPLAHRRDIALRSAMRHRPSSFSSRPVPGPRGSGNPACRVVPARTPAPAARWRRAHRAGSGSPWRGRGPGRRAAYRATVRKALLATARPQPSGPRRAVGQSSHRCRDARRAAVMPNNSACFRGAPWIGRW
ncbi:unnamed protein product [Mycetohabitans rhizoxinica HKI 454]|uniref:Uncharacterized protein n=1 Tax=Mycetohabitans rhizoxinica (strain DSM 19002 / CIP 109453 / HKI 454) TaxID=882378 RepID=E5ANL0_MYCRK|nr:unnamed protein product [Mycetohabitans rhizoxinica HKI 454]